MKRKRHTPEEIIKKLRTAEEALAGGKTVEEACRIISVTVTRTGASSMGKNQSVRGEFRLMAAPS